MPALSILPDLRLGVVADGVRAGLATRVLVVSRERSEGA